MSQSELQDLNQFVSMYLDYAERQAKRHVPMTMEDWASKLEVFLKMNDEDILMDKGKVTHEIAKTFAESEFEKYRVIQNQLYESDFDKLVIKLSCSKYNLPIIIISISSNYKGNGRIMLI